MRIEKNEPKPSKDGEPVSFRLTKDAAAKLNTLAKVLNRTKTGLIEDFIEQAFDEAKKKYPKDFR